jgi:hypothetical protein
LPREVLLLRAHAKASRIVKFLEFCTAGRHRSAEIYRLFCVIYLTPSR